MATDPLLIAQVNANTDAINKINSDAKKTSDFDLMPVLDPNALIRVEINGVSKHIFASQFSSVNPNDVEYVINKAIDFDTVNDIYYPTVKAAKDYIDSMVVGLLDDRGSYDASSNQFPTTGGSGTGGAILKGDLWFVSVAGTLGGIPVKVGDSFRALTDAPAQIATNWSILSSNLGYVPANDANVVHKAGDETINGHKTFNNLVSLQTLNQSADANYYSILTRNITTGEIEHINGHLNLNTAKIVITDFDNSNGYAIIEAAAGTTTNQPNLNNWGQGIQFSTNGNFNYSNQLIFDATGNLFTRSKTGGNFNAWKTILTNENIGGSSILNQNSVAQNASFWINGESTIDNSLHINGLALINNGLLLQHSGDHSRIGNKDANQILSLQGSAYTTFDTFDGTNWVERMRIDNHGNVGIGVPTVASNGWKTLSIGGVENLMFNLGSTQFISDVSSSYINESRNMPFRILTNGTERFRVSEIGNTLLKYSVDNGIDTLQVNGSASFSDIISIKASEGVRIINDNGYISGFNTLNTIRSGYIQISSNAITLQSETELKQIILNPTGGNILVGNTANNGVDKLQVTGSGFFSQTVNAGGLGTGLAPFNTSFRANRSGDTKNGISFQGIAVTDMYFGRAIGVDDLVIESQLQELVRFKADGSTEIHNKLTVGATINDGIEATLKVNGNANINDLAGVGLRYVTADTDGNLRAIDTESVPYIFRASIHLDGTTHTYSISSILKDTFHNIVWNFQPASRYITATGDFPMGKTFINGACFADEGMGRFGVSDRSDTHITFVMDNALDQTNDNSFIEIIVNR